jgi:hypothetical protein
MSEVCENLVKTRLLFEQPMTIPNKTKLNETKQNLTKVTFIMLFFL